MTKRENIEDPNSCWNKARDDEQVFILLERDQVMADTIREWIKLRIVADETERNSLKLVRAEALADLLDEKRMA